MAEETVVYEVKIDVAVTGNLDALEKLQTVIKQVQGDATVASTSFKTLAQSIDTLDKSTRSHLSSSRSLAQNLRESAFGVREMYSSVGALVGSMPQLSFATTAAGAGFRALAASLSGAETGLAAFSGVAITVGALLAAMAIASIKVASDFKDAMSDIATNANFTGEQIEQLGDAFKGISARTGQDVAEIGKAFAGVAGQLELYRGGVLSVAESTDFMNEATKLSIATGEQQAAVTKALANVLITYGLNLQDAAHASDVLNNISDATGLSLSELSQAIDRMHARLGGAVPTIEQAGVMLMAWVEAGNTGSRATLQLVRAIDAVSNPSETAAAQMKALGIAMADTNGQATDANFRLTELAKVYVTLDPIQQEVVRGAIAHGMAADQLGKFLGLLGEKSDEYREKAEKAGSTTDDVEKRMALLSRQMNILGESFKTAGINLGEKLIPPLNNLLGLLHNLTANGWPIRVTLNGASLGIGVGGGQLAPFAGGAAGAEVESPLGGAKAGGGFGPFDEDIDRSSDRIKAFGDAAVSQWQAVNHGIVREVGKLGADVVAQYEKDWLKLEANQGEHATTLLQTRTQIGRLVERATAAGVPNAEAMGENLFRAIGEGFATPEGGRELALEAIKNFARQLGMATESAEEALRNAGKKMAKTAMDGWVEGLEQGLPGAVEEAGKAGGAILAAIQRASLHPDEKGSGDALLNSIRDLTLKMRQAGMEDWQEMWESMTALGAGVIRGDSSSITALRELAVRAGKALEEHDIWEAWTKGYDKALRSFNEGMERFEERLGEIRDKMTRESGEAGSRLTEALRIADARNQLEDWQAAYKESVRQIKQGADDQAQSVEAAYKRESQAIREVRDQEESRLSTQRRFQDRVAGLGGSQEEDRIRRHGDLAKLNLEHSQKIADIEAGTGKDKSQQLATENRHFQNQLAQMRLRNSIDDKLNSSKMQQETAVGNLRNKRDQEDLANKTRNQREDLTRELANNEQKYQARKTLEDRIAGLEEAHRTDKRTKEHELGIDEESRANRAFNESIKRINQAGDLEIATAERVARRTGQVFEDAIDDLVRNVSTKYPWMLESLQGTGAESKQGINDRLQKIGPVGLGGGLGARGFAAGGSFVVGGSGGTDSQLVQFFASPGENVSVQTPGQSNADLQTALRDALREERQFMVNLFQNRPAQIYIDGKPVADVVTKRQYRQIETRVAVGGRY